MKYLVLYILSLVLCAAMVSYFLKPAPETYQISNPQEEIELLDISPTRDPKFAERIITSNLAVVLSHSDISSRNAVSLGALRDWAKSQFGRDPEFLRPVSLPNHGTHNNVFDALFHNLIGIPRFWLERQVAHGLESRVREFQASDSYQLFRIDFYELFGLDSEAALLLARYQEERARQTIDVIIGSSTIAILLCCGFLFRRIRRLGRLVPERFWLGYCWLIGSGAYLVLSCTVNSVFDLVASLICLAIGFYMVMPVRLRFSEDGGIFLSRIELTRRMLALLTWVSLTLVCIQILTWIRSGSLLEPDCVTLLVSGWTGDFIHDPSELKRALTQLIGIFWLALLARTLIVYRLGNNCTPELDAELESLDRVSLS